MKGIDFDLKDLLMSDEDHRANSSSSNDDYNLGDMLELIEQTPYSVRLVDGTLATDMD